MSWITNKDGVKEYKPSIYAKEELPTWDEIFHVWFEKKMFYYHPDNSEHQELAPYWNIPYRKYMILIICNQLNKMLFEDGYYQPMLDYLNSNAYIREYYNGEITDIRFVCENIPYLQMNKLPIEDRKCIVKDWREIADKMDDQESDYFHKYKIGIKEAPPIYTIPLPTKNENPFITDYPRISSDDIKGMISVIPLLKINVGDGDFVSGDLFYTTLLDIKYGAGTEDDDFAFRWVTIIKFLLKGIIHYFDEPVGWKDDKGNIISNDKPINNGADSAL